MSLSMGKKASKPTIAMAAVKSTNVKSIGYDAKSRTLAVSYASGGLYHYQGVPADVHASLQKAESVGKFLHAKVSGKFRSEKV